LASVITKVTVDQHGNDAQLISADRKLVEIALLIEPERRCSLAAVEPVFRR
jgi:hypothetical protein